MRWRLPPSRSIRPSSPPASGPGPGPVVLVLPAHDEAVSVGSVVTRTPASVAGRPVHCLVVDDGSTDGTATAALAAGAVVVGHPQRRGLGAAIRTGLREAVALGAAIVAFCDADGEYAPEELPRLVAPIEGGQADYVVGSRFTGDIHFMLRRRRLGNRVLTLVLRWITRTPVTDGQSGYRALARAAAIDAHIEHDYNYAQVLTIDLLGKGYRYAEVPISYSFRTNGRSFVRLGRYLRAVVPAVARAVRRVTPPAERRAGARARAALPTALSIVALGFAAVALTRHWGDARHAIARSDVPLLAAGAAAAAVGMVALARPWHAVLARLGAVASPLHTLAAYFTGELAKYVPGGVWPVVGRAERARRLGVPGDVAYASVALSLGFAYLAAAVTVALAVPAVIVTCQLSAWTLAVLAVVPLGVVGLHPTSQRLARRAVERIVRRPLPAAELPWPAGLRLVAAYVPAWCCIGTATTVVAWALAGPVDVAPVFSAALVSWIAGFLVVPAPGGAGIRELAFAAVAPLPLGTGLVVAAATRLVFVTVDLAAFTVGAVVLRMRRPTVVSGSVLHDV